MPYLNFDVDIEDFLNECSDRDIENIITYLIEDGVLHEKEIFVISQDGSLYEQEINGILQKINKNKLQLTIEEEETLRKIANRF